MGRIIGKEIHSPGHSSRMAGTTQLPRGFLPRNCKVTLPGYGFGPGQGKEADQKEGRAP